MPPSRGKDMKAADRKDGTSKSPRKSITKRVPNDLELPGVQKLKSALRQTRRMLAKDNLNADVRVETERRLKSLENDLQLAETKRKERAMATKYHKVKFFERKKIMRKIAQVKKEIESEEPTSSKSIAKLEKKLFKLRVDLNYILHYPKLEKYIALLPAPADADKAEPPADDKSHPRRQQIRDDVKRRMQSGELNGQPELQTKEEKSTRSKPSQSQTLEIDRSEKTKKKRLKEGKDDKLKPVGGAEDSVMADDFFEADGALSD